MFCNYFRFLKKMKELKKKEDNAIVLYLSPIRNTCEICNTGFEISNRYGTFTCVSCSLFFELNVVLTKEIICCKTRSGKCSVDRSIVGDEELCKFCRLNKCYDVKINYEIITDHPNFIQRCLAAREKEIQDFNQELELIQCLIYMEQYYYKWLNLFPSFRRLSEKQKGYVRLKSHVYGAIMQLIERSLYVYRTIRLHNCFLYNMKPTDILFFNLIKSLIDFRDGIKNSTENIKEFHVKKLQFTLQDDVVLRDSSLKVRKSSRNMLENIADKVLEVMKENSRHLLFEGKENFRKIESLNLFDYSSNIPEEDYPYNKIDFCVKL
ncbi:uncharacterized protein LOC111629976 isoform X2 [Centruroides sculpturatus]|uniref:uncharacterized protein LOC111629976 isoform X2 n=1 Tax=Centruroides sculpturatus TaxID=218467 RepID=UPI000C6CC4E2|nr:uncharacterized protein LOC111629976 isoform X2 [Centruroides sculpturatus]